MLLKYFGINLCKNIPSASVSFCELDRIISISLPAKSYPIKIYDEANSLIIEAAADLQLILYFFSIDCSLRADINISSNISISISLKSGSCRISYSRGFFNRLFTGFFSGFSGRSVSLINTI